MVRIGIEDELEIERVRSCFMHDFIVMFPGDNDKFLHRFHGEKFDAVQKE